MKRRWMLEDLAVASGGELIGDNTVFCGSVKVDSQQIMPGDCFVALPGKVSDGHLYLGDAIKRGATLLILEREKASRTVLRSLPITVSAILVENSKAALVQMAAGYLRYICPREVVAITGSVGKTTTREMIKSTLGESLKIHGAKLSYNTLIGCAVTILEMPVETEILILEMGTSSPGEISEMVNFFPPTIAVITEIASAHLQGLLSIEGVLAAKLEIADSKKLRVIFFNADNELLKQGVTALPSEIRKIGVGYRGDIRIKNSAILFQEGHFSIQFNFQEENIEIALKAPLFGIHNAYCVTLAVAVARMLGISAEMCRSRVASFGACTGRGLVKNIEGKITIIDESYNANPKSMLAAIEAMAVVPETSRKLGVLGSMKELGDSSLELHSHILDQAVAKLDYIILLGPEWQDVLFIQGLAKKKVSLCKNVSEVVTHIRTIIKSGDFILIKGSRKNHLEHVAESLVSLN